jgi:hypothetical protein
LLASSGLSDTGQGIDGLFEKAIADAPKQVRTWIDKVSPEVAAKCVAARERYRATKEVKPTQLARAMISMYGITTGTVDTIRRWLEQ